MAQFLSAAIAAPRPRPSAVLELLKPITWFAPMWADMGGVVSAGEPTSGRWLAIAASVLLAGPLECGANQAVTDWYDRHVDAVNEPDRPIPSGRVPGTWGLQIGVVMTLLVAWSLGTIVLAAAVVGLVLAWIYSALPDFPGARNDTARDLMPDCPRPQPRATIAEARILARTQCPPPQSTSASWSAPTAPRPASTRTAAAPPSWPISSAC